MFLYIILRIIAPIKSPAEVANELFKNYNDDLIRLFICQNRNLSMDTILRIAIYYNGYSVILNYEFKRKNSIEANEPISIVYNHNCPRKLRNIIKPPRIFIARKV